MTALANLELIPVVEIGPDHLDLPAHVFRRGVSPRQAWVSEYWRLQSPVPPPQRSVFMPASLVVPALTKRLLRNLANPLDGGYLLRVDGRTVHKPGCCADLGALSAWERAARWRRESWFPVWNGHPLLAVRRAGATLELSNTHDLNRRPTRTILAVHQASFRHMVESARAMLEALAATLAHQVGEARARKLLGLVEVPDDA